MFDATTGCFLHSKKPDTAQILIVEIDTNEYQLSSERNNLVKSAGIYEVDVLTTLGNQVLVITKE